MKKNILYIIGLGLMFVYFFSSCNQDHEKEFYDMNQGELYSMQHIAMIKELTPEQNGIMQIPVTRTHKTGEGSVNVEVIGDDAVKSVFKLKNPVLNFPSGEAVSFAEVEYDIESLSTTDRYTFKIALTDSANMSQGGAFATSITASRKLTFESVGKGVYASGAFGGAAEVTYFRAIEAKNVYKMSGFFKNEIIFNINKADGTSKVPAQSLGQDIFGEGTISWIVCDAGTYKDGVCVFGGGTWDNAFFVDAKLNSGLRLTNEQFILPEGSY